MTGIADGYDVYGGGAGNTSPAAATDKSGQAGGFIGCNNEGLLENNSMIYCDTVKGEADVTGPFIGKLEFDSAYEDLGNTADKIVGNQNTYKIYRNTGAEYTGLTNISPEGFETEADWSNIYVIHHYGSVQRFAQLNGVEMESSVPGTQNIPLAAYVSSAEAKLMDGTPTYENGTSETPEPPDVQDPCDEFIDLTINKVWKDNNNQSGKRPDSLVLELWKTYTGADGQTVTVKLQDIALTEKDHENTGNTWQYIFENLPAYETGAEGEKYWITYEIREPNVPDGYELTGIENSEDGFTITVTNSLPWRELLPVTGGMGTIFLYVLSAGLVAGVGVSLIASSGQRRRRRGSGRRRMRQ